MKDEYQYELFKKFCEHPNWQRQQSVVLSFLGAGRIFSFPLQGAQSKAALLEVIAATPSLRAVSESLGELLQECSRKGVICSGTDPNGAYHHYFFPLKRGEQLYGIVLLCELVEKLSPEAVELISAYTATSLETVQKEFELTKLYDTIRPKTIALSTVHTIGRIMSSTLELDQLLPRIGRLSLQVLRARRSMIMLVDDSKRVLLPHVLIDLQDKHAKQQKLKIGQGVPGQVLKTGRTVIRAKYICVPLIADENVIGTISISHRQDGNAFTIFDQEILTTFSEQAVIAIKNAQLYEEQEKLTINSIQALASILSSGDYQFGRSNLFINIAMSIGMELKLNPEQMRILYYAAILHNVSQLGLPHKILSKATKLTDKDYRIIREHPMIGAEIIRPIGGKMKDVLPIIIYHHERYDGQGYPSGLKGESIPLGARILSVADTFEAMLTKRPYRKKLSLGQAVAEIVKLSGEQFDPVVVDAFVRVVKHYKNKIFKAEKNTWIWKKY